MSSHPDRSVDGPEDVGRVFASLAAGHVVFEAASIGPHDIDAREAALVAGAVEKRRFEFETGRWCAARALARAGAPRGPILRGAFYEPLWPTGFAGSITHQNNIAVAAARAVRDGRRAAIGIDLVDLSSLEPFAEVLPLISSGRDELGVLAMAHPLAAAYLFSIKEAAVKCLSSTLKSFIDVRDLRVRPVNAGHHVDHPETDMPVVARSEAIGRFLATFASTSSDDISTRS